MEKATALIEALEEQVERLQREVQERSALIGEMTEIIKNHDYDIELNVRTVTEQL